MKRVPVIDMRKKLVFDALTTKSLATTINHPPHYGGDVPYEVIKVIEAWEKMFPHLTWNLLTAVKYIPRAAMKDPLKEIEDLEKAVWYIQREIDRKKAAL